MFDDYGHRRCNRGSAASLLGSFALHAFLLVLVVRAFAPNYIKTSAVRQGSRGTSIALLYWPARPTRSTEQSADDSSPARPHEARSKAALTWQSSRRRAQPAEHPPELERKSDQNTVNPRVQARLAGSPDGSLAEGALTGSEVRPAIRVSGPNPVLSFEDLPDGHQGTVVVEVTIDAAGNIVAARVLQSLAPAIDAKVLAAVQEWHFLPATRDGAAIASKQDVLYHFPR
jgi:TonB family protein